MHCFSATKLYRSYNRQDHYRMSYWTATSLLNRLASSPVPMDMMALTIYLRLTMRLWVDLYRLSDCTVPKHLRRSAIVRHWPPRIWSRWHFRLQTSYKERALEQPVPRLLYIGAQYSRWKIVNLYTPNSPHY